MKVLIQNKTTTVYLAFDISLGAQDIFRQSSTVHTKMRDLPVHPCIKNRAQNEYQNKNFHHILVNLTVFFVFSCNLMSYTR